MNLPGRPPATVRWLRDGRVLEAAETRPDAEGGPWSVRSLLVVAALSRADLHATLTCRASNSPLAPPVEATVRLDLYLRPLWASIMGERIPLSAGRPHDIQCRSAGSRPPANITWWIDNAGIDALTHKVSPDLNETVSTLRLTAGASDHDRVVTCRAENSHVRGGVEEDSWRLDVYFMPMVQLHLGPNLAAENIKEGSDVYFECKMRANPAAYKVVWTNNGEVILHNTSAGVIVSSSHLALQSVTRKQAGSYSCIASNVEGDGRSNVVNLAVKYKPVCHEGEQRPVTIAVGLGERATVNCSVDALPTADSFRWSLGNSSYLPGLDPAIAAPPPPDSGAGQSLQLIPLSQSDYGTLLCWASNAVGIQVAPCVFHIVPAGKPDPASNCTLVNQTSTSLQLECLEGFDGGRPQRFELLVEEVSTGRLLSNVTSRWPSFGVAGLRAGQALRLTVTAFNSRGRSMSVALDAYTLKAAELRTGVPVPFELTPILSVLLSVATVLLLAVAGIVGSQRVRSSKQRQQDAGAIKAGPDVEDPNPDLIPPTRGVVAAGATPQDSPGNDAAPRHPQLVPGVAAAADRNTTGPFYQAPRLWTLRQTDQSHIAGMKVLEPVLSEQQVLDRGRSAPIQLGMQQPQKPRDLVALRRGSTVATEVLPEDTQQESCV
ncbi:nephrin-like [Schistocerca serialis cubense]|uniref:nephrin-like n=1 Tax=Schistocerca serialis cubense TaxID=2023355 RepID=UPI00214E2895|nr:nephrin-like [Schistocerca serialis cubense]